MTPHVLHPNSVPKGAGFRIVGVQPRSSPSPECVLASSFIVQRKCSEGESWEGFVLWIQMCTWNAMEGPFWTVIFRDDVFIVNLFTVSCYIFYGLSNLFFILHWWSYRVPSFQNHPRCISPGGPWSTAWSTTEPGSSFRWGHSAKVLNELCDVRTWPFWKR